MSQQSLILSFVARGTVILAQYTEFSGNFVGIASQCLQQLSASNDKVTFICDGHSFNYWSKTASEELGWLRFEADAFGSELDESFCVVGVESTGRQIPIALLERIKEDFNKRYGGGKAATAVPNSLSKEFGPKLKEHMQYCADHPEEISKLANAKAQVSEIKGVMRENMEKAFCNKERIDRLEGEAQTIQSHAQDFR